MRPVQCEAHGLQSLLVRCLTPTRVSLRIPRKIRKPIFDVQQDVLKPPSHHGCLAAQFALEIYDADKKNGNYSQDNISVSRLFRWSPVARTRFKTLIYLKGLVSEPVGRWFQRANFWRNEQNLGRGQSD